MGKFVQFFKNLKIKTKLFILIIGFFVSIILILVFNEYLFGSLRTFNIITAEQQVFITQLHRGIEELYEYEITKNPVDFQESQAALNKAFNISYTLSHFDSIMNAMPKEEWLEYFYHMFEDVVDNEEHMESIARQFQLLKEIDPDSYEGLISAATQGYQAIDEIRVMAAAYAESGNIEMLLQVENEIDDLDPIIGNFSQQTYILYNRVRGWLNWIMITMVTLLFGIAALIAFQIAKSIVKPIESIAENFKKIEKGDLNSSIKIDSKNEIGDMSRAFLNIQLGIQRVISHSKKVANGDYSAVLTPKSDKDELAVSLNKMTRQLKETRENTERENWLRDGLNKIDDEMRGNLTVEELSDRLISFLSRFLNVEMGAVYVFDDEAQKFEFTGSIGIEKEKVNAIVKPGEGLIGKAAKDGSLQIIEPKEKYHKTYSASGEVFPEQLYLMPLHNDGQILAVIELAPLNAFTDIKIKYLNSIKERISVNLNAAVARCRNSKLLNQTIEQAKVLEERDIQLNQKLEENRKIQKELQKQNALLNAMLSTLPDYVYFKDVNSKFIRVSDSMIHHFGANSSSDIIGKSDFDFHLPDKAKKYFDEEQEIIKSGKGFADDVRQEVTASGKSLWTLVTKLPMFSTSGEVIGTFGLSRDITHIKELELEIKKRNQELKEQHEQLQATNEELKTQEEELRVANEELAQHTRILTENEKNLQTQQEELRVINEELAQKTGILEKQKKEITEKNDYLLKTQNELRQKARELEQTSRYKSEFLANMSHELRTPLNSLLILSKLLSSNKKGNLTEDQVKSVNIIHKSGNDLLNLINEILDLSKIEAGKMKYEFGVVPVNELLDEIKQNFTPVAENKNLELKIEKEEKFPEKMYTDKQRLLQIVKNLLSNAFKFTSAGSVKVTFGVPEKSTLFINDKLSIDKTCFISVEDTGVGIAKEKVEGIFEAFQQADGSISRKFGGTGLGLSISKQLTQVLGGEIHVESTEGEGSIFTVYLPLDEKLVGAELNKKGRNDQSGQAKSKETKNIESEVGQNEENSEESSKMPFFLDDDRDSGEKKLLILVIHSDKNKAQNMIDLCHKRKFNVLAASNISDGIKLAQQFSPGAIIISVEQSNSKELKNLKTDNSTKSLPLHVVSKIDDTVLDDIEAKETPDREKTSNHDDSTVEKTSQYGKPYKEVLVVEDDSATREAIQILFEDKDIIIHEAVTAQQAYDLISTKPFDSVILDLGLPDYSGKELLGKLRKDKIPIPNIVINTARELSNKELRELHEYSDSIVIKGVKSDERLMDEVTLFLHQVENSVTPAEYPVNTKEFSNDGFKGKKILVVDDDIRNLFAIAQILEEREIEVVEAENGQAAIEVLQKNNDIDLVLMDIMMPVMDGYEAMTAIRKIKAFEDLPIITLTAKAMKEDYQKAIDSGANDYISKPVDTEKLISLLKIWLFR